MSDRTVEDDERSYMIMGVDENGDMHLVGTNDPARAVSHYVRMAETMAHVQGNAAFRGIADPAPSRAN